MSEYDPMFPRKRRDRRDLERARALFENAARPFLRSHWTWVTWAVLLPAAAIATPQVATARGPLAVLLLWSVTILLGGVVEGVVILRNRGVQQTGLAAWVLRAQGNISLVAVALSVLLVATGTAWALPALWLLLLGHSLYTVGGLALGALRTAGLIYQLGGFLALWPRLQPFWVFAAATALGNLVVAREMHTRAKDMGAQTRGERRADVQVSP